MVIDLGQHVAEKARAEAQRRALAIPEGDIPLPSIGATLRYMGCHAMGPDVPAGHIWVARARKLNVIASSDFHERHGFALLHVSLSHPRSLPDWAEVLAVREAFYPEDVDVAMILPRREDYISVHDYAFHLQQLPAEWGAR